ncbi:hypothetical protein GOBAR_AA24432 [Gossypium barbadense]|uniref:Small ribosomal subunit protein uS17 N-terminal domain-containing protein n=1 Tax=Gossypium barbadense TaxID=3634 RepID=A0A2P5WYS8_GOSBA|nr:hypothetical protein GOBAR_AA24432 [Gossypium barbadense]
MAEQTEKAFLKQPKVFLTYIDKKCPFTGTVSIRGRILAGTCHSAKMIRTIVSKKSSKGKRPGKGGNRFWKSIGLGFKTPREAIEGSVFLYEKRHSNIPAHISPCFRVKEGDHVIIGQCRPLSKTVRFNVLKVIPAGSSGGGKKAFTGMLN